MSKRASWEAEKLSRTESVSVSRGWKLSSGPGRVGEKTFAGLQPWKRHTGNWRALTAPNTSF